VPPTPAIAAWAVLGGLLLLASWKARHAPLGSSEFQLTTALALAGTILFIPMIAPYNCLLLLPGIFWLLRNGGFPGKVGLLVDTAAVAAIAWPWLSAAALALGLLFLPRPMILAAWHVPLWTALMIPVTTFAALALRFVAGSSPGKA
jgi:hypothetical protein